MRMMFLLFFSSFFVGKKTIFLEEIISANRTGSVEGGLQREGFWESNIPLRICLRKLHIYISVICSTMAPFTPGNNMWPVSWYIIYRPLHLVLINILILPALWSDLNMQINSAGGLGQQTREVMPLAKRTSIKKMPTWTYWKLLWPRYVSGANVVSWIIGAVCALWLWLRRSST